jgi:hypothetical protein
MSDKFDGLLMSMMSQCEGGAPEALDNIFSFFARRTDFYHRKDGSGDQVRKLVLDAFTKHEKVAQDIADEKKRKYDEIDRKRKEKAQAQKQMEQNVKD